MRKAAQIAELGIGKSRGPARDAATILMKMPLCWWWKIPLMVMRWLPLCASINGCGVYRPRS
jgi:hypothetical protein